MKIPTVTLNRHFFTVVACALIVFTLGALSNAAWHSQVVQAQLNAQVEALARASKARRQAVEVTQEQNRLKAECTKEVAYYNSLSTRQKSLVTAPDCQKLQVVE